MYWQFYYRKTSSIFTNGTDYFLYSTANASDHLYAPATAGASIRVFASDDTAWFVEANGTFTVVGY